jgi:hypothetical protein
MPSLCCVLYVCVCVYVHCLCDLQEWFVCISVCIDLYVLLGYLYMWAFAQG